MICPNCQTPNPESAKFCMNCGTPLAAGGDESTKNAKSSIGTAATPQDPKFLGQYLPPELVAKLEAARKQGGMAGERRIITMLFCDVKGSTAAAEKVDPEVWTDIMNGAFERMIGPIYKYEGTVPRLMGDAILAFFGAPIAHEDDPQRAVWAGLDIQAGMQSYVEEMHRTHGLDFGLRVGINTGLVVVGEIGSDLRMEYTAIGDAINLAARMEQTAAPGTVQITEETHKLIAPLFDFESLGGIEVKGKAEPVTAYRVIGRKAEPGHLRGVEGLSSPLVGRDEQLGVLRERLSQLGAGAGGFVAIVGEAGLGKSSLIAEAHRAAGGDGWLKGESLSYSRSISYFPWRQIIRQSIEAREQDAPADVRSKLRTQCDGCTLPGGDIPFLEAMLSVESDESLKIVAGYQGEALVQRMTEAARGYLCGLAGAHPLTLVFDDLHWADEASLSLLLNASELASEQPILFLCMLRPDKDAPSWRSMQDVELRLGQGFRSITLQPLGAEQTDALLANLLGMKKFPTKLRGLILEKAGGNPFFVEELIRSLIETKQIVRENSHWRAANDEASVMLPDTLRGVLSARIDRLPEPGRHVLQMASVIGRTFDLQVLEQIAKVEGLEQQVAKLQEAGLVEATPSDYAFRHVMIQEAAYDSILMKKRGELHRQVGESLEQLHAGRLEEFAPLLAYHFYAAHDDRSLKYDLLAGDKAARLYANAEAATHYRRALETARRIGVDAAQLADIFTKFGAVLELTGRYAEALTTYDEMQAFAHEHAVPSMELSALIAKGTIYSTPTAMRDPDKGEQTMIRALELSHSVGDLKVQTKLSWNMMLNYLHSGRLDPALEYGERALKLAREAGDEEQLAFVLNDMGRVLICRGDFGSALEVIHEAGGLFNRLENRVMQADNLGAEEEALFSMGSFDQVAPLANRALEICESMDNAWGKSYHRLLMGLAYSARGELQTAIRLITEAAELGDQGGLIISSIAGRCDLAWCYGSCGDVDKALEVIEPAIATARANLPDWAVMPMAIKIRLHALQGDLRAAEEAASVMELVPPTLPYPHYTMMVHRARVDLAWLRGDYQGVLTIIAGVVADMERVVPGEIIQLMGRKADALLALNRPEEAHQVLSEARTMAESFGAQGELWLILGRMAQVDAMLGKQAEAEASREAALRIVHKISDGLREVGLQDTFMAQPAAQALLGKK